MFSHINPLPDADEAGDMNEFAHTFDRPSAFSKICSAAATPPISQCASGMGPSGDCGRMSGPTATLVLRHPESLSRMLRWPVQLCHRRSLHL